MNKSQSSNQVCSCLSEIGMMICNSYAVSDEETQGSAEHWCACSSRGFYCLWSFISLCSTTLLLAAQLCL